MSGKYSLGVLVMFIIGLAIGFGIGDLSHRRDGRSYFNGRIAAKHHPWANHNNTQVAPAIAASQNGKWDPFDEMKRMQKEVNRDIERATQQLGLGSASMPDLNNTAGFSSALNVRDRGDHFEVRADLPNTDQKDVKVTTEGDREVRVNVTQRQEQNKNADGEQSSFSEFGSYDQVVTLPSPADMKDMKVDNRNGELMITIPKAKA